MNYKPQNCDYLTNAHKDIILTYNISLCQYVYHIHHDMGRYLSPVFVVISSFTIASVTRLAARIICVVLCLDYHSPQAFQYVSSGVASSKGPLIESGFSDLN